MRKIPGAFFIAVFCLLIATPLFSWTDDPVQADVTPIRAVHINELRDAIDSKRAGFGMSDSFPSGVGVGDTIRPQDFNGLISPIEEVRSAFTDDCPWVVKNWPPLTPVSSGNPIRAQTIATLRGVVDGLGTCADCCGGCRTCAASGCVDQPSGEDRWDYCNSAELCNSGVCNGAGGCFMAADDPDCGTIDCSNYLGIQGNGCYAKRDFDNSTGNRCKWQFTCKEANTGDCYSQPFEGAPLITCGVCQYIADCTTGGTPHCETMPTGWKGIGCDGYCRRCDGGTCVLSSAYDVGGSGGEANMCSWRVPPNAATCYSGWCNAGDCVVINVDAGIDCYPDQDCDGYGAAGSSSHHKGCGGQCLGQYFDGAPHCYANNTNDCNDIRNTVYPGSNISSNYPTNGPGTGWDFNCDGVETLDGPPTYTKCPAGYMDASACVLQTVTNQCGTALNADTACTYNPDGSCFGNNAGGSIQGNCH